MEIKIITDSQPWDSWLKNNSQHNSFTQAWAWGDILLAEGKKVERLAIVESEEVLAQAQIVYSQLPFGKRYAFCSQGPIESSKLKVESYKVYDLFLKYLKDKNYTFFRIEPDNIQYPISNFKKTIDINPSATLILNLEKTEEELLAGMHQKTRYNIHLAEKKGLRITEEKNLEVFWSLMNKTGKRDKFNLHEKKHYQTVLASSLIRQFTAYYNHTPVASVVCAQFGKTFTYLYGAADYEYRNLMAPYLLQWEGIKMGKSSGCQWYDFFGVAPRRTSDYGLQTMDYQYDPHHQYAGVTRFKLGFGGMPYQTPGTFDVVIDAGKYKIYNLLRKIRRIF